MKIRSVKFNNKRKNFEVKTSRKAYAFPYAKSTPKPTADDLVARLYVDKELAAEGFTQELQSGRTGSALVRHSERGESENNEGLVYIASVPDMIDFKVGSKF